MQFYSDDKGNPNKNNLRTNPPLCSKAWLSSPSQMYAAEIKIHRLFQKGNSDVREKTPGYEVGDES